MITNNQENNIALFLDMENLIRSAMEIALPVDLAPIVNKLLEHGRLSLRRGYGDLDAACRGDLQLRMNMRRMIHQNLVQFEDIPYVTQFKNTADMRLAVEALSVAYSYPDINYFAIVASDRDYVPVIAKLKELGKRIIGIGTSPDTVHEIYVKSCDVFIYYSSLFPVSKTENAVVEPGDPALLEHYFQLLVQATTALVQKGVKAVGAQIMPLMRQLRPDFDLQLVKLNSFRELVSLAEQRNLVTVNASGADVLLQLGPKSETVSDVTQTASRIDAEDPSGAKILYRQFMEDKMKCPLPSLAVRVKIYEQATRIVETRRLLGRHVNLVDLSAEVVHQIGTRDSSITQPMVFKVLYSLFRANAFEAELNDQPYNPNIKSCKARADECDRLFIRNSIFVMSRERRTWPLMEQLLAELFETTWEVVAHEIDAVPER